MTLTIKLDPGCVVANQHQRLKVTLFKSYYQTHRQTHKRDRLLYLDH